VDSQSSPVLVRVLTLAPGVFPQAVSGVVGAPARLADWAFGTLDERRARRLREELGRRRWLVSWQRDPDGRWRARLSGPETPRTVERTARTRSRAIERAARAMGRILDFRSARAMERMLVRPSPNAPARDLLG
jgi:hypothetical protein